MNYFDVMIKAGEVRITFRRDLGQFQCQWQVHGKSFTSFGETAMDSIASTLKFAKEDRLWSPALEALFA